MKNARIFLAAEEEGKWVPMEESPYDQEIILQAALADYPELLPGDQINPENPRTLSRLLWNASVRSTIEADVK
jgi:hypothetical protein